MHGFVRISLGLDISPANKALGDGDQKIASAFLASCSLYDMKLSKSFVVI